MNMGWVLLLVSVLAGIGLAAQMAPRFRHFSDTSGAGKGQSFARGNDARPPGPPVSPGLER
jgi:hypothetical protein